MIQVLQLISYFQSTFDVALTFGILMIQVLIRSNYDKGNLDSFPMLSHRNAHRRATGSEIINS